MTILAGEQSALILAAGLFMCFAGPSQAAASMENTAANSKSETAAPIMLKKHNKYLHHWKGYARRKSNTMALKSFDRKRTAATDITAHDGSSTIPTSVANANAQLISSETPPVRSVQALYERANDILLAMPNKPADTQLAANTQVVSADQLNDIDRSLREHTPSAGTLAIAPAEAPIARIVPFVPVATSSSESSTSNESSTWDQPTLIGKIFICFGTILTMTSAVRLLIA